MNSIFARVIVISDIDDTIKMSNSMGGVSGIYHFLRMKSYPIMRSIYSDIENYYGKEGVSFFYVSAAPDYIYNQDHWLKEKGFPAGESYLRQSITVETYKFKMQVITKLLSNIDDKDSVLLFGDNSSFDPKVYQDIINGLSLKKAKIFIRDVNTSETFDLDSMDEKSNVRIKYFFSEKELIDEGLALSDTTLEAIETSISNETLVPLYTLKTLKRRLRKERVCSGKCQYAEELFFDYY